MMSEQPQATPQQDHEPSSHHPSLDVSQRSNAEEDDSSSLPGVMAAAAALDHQHHHHHPLLQVLSIFLYIASWVANAESLQGICNGTLCPNGEAYNKPGFLTWLDFNLMVVGFLLVWPWIRRHHGGSFWTFVCTVWTGTWSLSRMVISCTGLSFLLSITHVFYVIGLQKISVASLNAAYQVQAVCTLALSIWVFGGQFTDSQKIGIVVSIVGVASIVLPPLWVEDNGANPGGSSSTMDALIGLLATIVSAALWGCYQVAWRALHESKLKEVTNMTRTEELVGTIFTLAVIGVANLVVGWIILPPLDWIGFEKFELPPVALTGVLTINAVIEYAFNAFIAIAIHMTSPLATSLVAPLTIPLSWVSDMFLYNIPLSSATTGGWGWMGALFIVIGLYLLELKPSFKNNSQRESNSLLPTNASNSQDYVPMERSRLVLDK